MKRYFTSVPVILLLLMLSARISQGQNLKTADKQSPDSVVTVKDGTYEGMSRGKYIYEPYWGRVRFTIKDGKYTEIRFGIRDSSLHETFDGKYEKHFEGNAEYIQQSRNDWKGVQTYPKNLAGKGDVNKLDAISGATWSYNIFRASVNEALKNNNDR